jgi:hypothetical protein
MDVCQVCTKIQNLYKKLNNREELLQKLNILKKKTLVGSRLEIQKMEER